MNKLVLCGALFLCTSAAHAGPVGKLKPGSLPRLAPIASNLTPTIPIVRVPTLPALPGLPVGPICDGATAGCLPRVPEIPGVGVPYWVGANANQYRVYAMQVVPYVQAWAGQPHLKNIQGGTLAAVGEVVNVNACDGVCAPKVNAQGAPKALAKLEQMGKGIIPNPPSPPTPIMPGGHN
jgi:hypothetical protein